MPPRKKEKSASAGDRLEAFVRASLKVHAEHTLEGVLQQVADAARAVTGARFAALGVLAPNGESLSTFITSGLSAEAHARIGALPTGRGVLGLLIRHPHPLRLPDISRHPKAHGFPPNHPPMTSFLGVPVRGREGPFGNLYLTDKEGAPEFSDEDEAVALMLAAQAAVAIENARLYQESSRLLSELQEMQGARDRFYAMINHELRNALTGVYGWADLLVRKGGDVPRAAREVHEAAEHTLGLVNDLLDISRIEAARMKPIVRACDVGDLVREAAATLEPTAARRGVQIEITGLDQGVPWQTDPQRVRQILINLLSNAVRHSPDAGVIRVEAAATESRIRIDVVDRGEGIAPEQQEMIFEAFVQADSARERGTGLGLTLSRRLARLLGGDLRVESRVNIGSRFILDLPRENP